MNKLFTAKIEKLLTTILLVENLARKKSVSAFFLSIIKNIQFLELAYGLNDSVKVESNEPRIQDFFEHNNAWLQPSCLIIMSVFTKR